MNQDAVTPDPQQPARPVAGAAAVPPPPPAPPISSPAPMDPFLLAPYQTPPDPEPPRRKYALFAGAGLVVGLGAGLLIPAIDFPSSVLPDALDSCAVELQWGIGLGDDGQSLTVDGQGDDDALGVPYADTLCILAAVDTPDGVISRMGSTRALDGMQTAEWDRISAYWTYHPEDGLDVVLEVVN